MERRKRLLELSEEHHQIEETAWELVYKEIIPNRLQLDESNQFPSEIFKKFKEVELFAALFEEEYDGLGLGFQTTIILSEILAYGCLGVSTAFFAHKLGATPIEVAGTPEQKKKWLTQMSNGEKIGAFALSEPDSGSDVPGMRCTAVRDGNEYVINGTKAWISNGGEADYYTVFCKTAVNRGTRGISCILVEKGTKGFSFGKKEDKLGIRCSSTCQLIFEDCRVPRENLVGGIENRGFIQAFKTLVISRPGIAAAAVGLMQAAFDDAISYARQREQFEVKISSFQSIQHILADMAMAVENSRLLTDLASQKVIDNEKDAPKFSAMAKCYASDSAMEVASNAVQIFGGNGYTKEYPVEKYFRDAKILQIYEGTSQIQKNEIASWLIKESASRARRIKS